MSACTDAHCERTAQLTRLTQLGLCPRDPRLILLRRDENETLTFRGGKQFSRFLRRIAMMIGKSAAFHHHGADIGERTEKFFRSPDSREGEHALPR